MAELLTGLVLFPGAEAMEQFKLIIDLCGAPDAEVVFFFEKIFLFFYIKYETFFFRIKIAAIKPKTAKGKTKFLEGN
jgi:hypothetical protein